MCVMFIPQTLEWIVNLTTTPSESESFISSPCEPNPHRNTPIGRQSYALKGMGRALHCPGTVDPTVCEGK